MGIRNYLIEGVSGVGKTTVCKELRRRGHHAIFDRVFVLEVDLATLNQRLAKRPETEWGGRPADRKLITRLHASKEDLPEGGVQIDATPPIEEVVDGILARSSPPNLS